MIPSTLLVVTDRHGSARPLVETIQAVLDGGARWIWFRDRDLERPARRDLASELLELVHAAGGRLTIGGDAPLAAEIGAGAMHLGAGHQDLAPSRSLPPDVPASAGFEGGVPSLTGFSAHSLDDVRRSAQAGADYVTLSPVFLSASKPGYGPALGLDVLREAATIGPSVIALGGIAPETAAPCRDAGAAGIAVMGPIMRAADPAAATRRFLRALNPSI